LRLSQKLTVAELSMAAAIDLHLWASQAMTETGTLQKDGTELHQHTVPEAIRRSNSRAAGKKGLGQKIEGVY
jgi:hypothetical protein